MRKKATPPIAFDLGNVLFGFNYECALKEISGRMKATPQEVIHAFYCQDFTLPFEKGLVSADVFFEQFCTAFSANLSFAEFTDIWCNIFFPLPEVIQLARGLKHRYPLYLISNINELHFNYLLARYPEVFNLFDDLLLSFRLRTIKPEREIYEILGRTAQTELRNIVYIDDRAELIAAAKKLKLQCIQFSTYRRLKHDLEILGIL